MCTKPVIVVYRFSSSRVLVTPYGDAYVVQIRCFLWTCDSICIQDIAEIDLCWFFNRVSFLTKIDCRRLRAIVEEFIDQKFVGYPVSPVISCVICRPWSQTPPPTKVCTIVTSAGIITSYVWDCLKVCSANLFSCEGCLFTVIIINFL